MKTMGDRIRDRLSEMKRSQYWLAAQVGIKQPSLNKVINAKDGEGTKHVVSIAKHLGLRPEYLATGEGERLSVQPRGEAVLVGYIGAGDKVFRTEEGGVLEGGILPPTGYASALAARIRGNSMRPLEPGWLVFYEQERQFDESCINRLSAVGLADGSVYIKKLRKSGKQFRLESWNAEPIEDAKVVWASRVIEIRPQ